MNVDAVDFHVIVIAHKVDGVSYLSQFACVLEEVYHDVRLVYTEAEVSLALLGTLLTSLSERLDKRKSRHPCTDIVNGGKVEIVEILPVAASADVLRGKQTQTVRFERTLACYALGVADALTCAVLSDNHQRLLAARSTRSQFTAALHAYLL